MAYRKMTQLCFIILMITSCIYADEKTAVATAGKKTSIPELVGPVKVIDLDVISDEIKGGAPNKQHGLVINQATLMPLVVEKPKSFGKDIEFKFGGKFKPESFYASNFNYLNSSVDADKVLFARHTLDLNLDTFYGRAKFGHNAAQLRLSIRNRGIWGNPSSISPTTEESLRFDDAVIGNHKHFIPRHILWLREGWLKFSINDALGLDFKHDHTFTLGAFPFELGRGIALGDVYAVGPDFLGFYQDGLVDQYAFGAKFNGIFIDDVLDFDLYVGVLQNNTGAMSTNEAKIYSQRYDRRSCPARGFGHINFAFAGRINWTAYNGKHGKLDLEPYLVYNIDPEQKIEFVADASLKLASLGLAAEYEGDCFEFGFDTAVNLGTQRVHGWDRNVIQIQNRDNRTVFVNSHVAIGFVPTLIDIPDLYKAPHSPKMSNGSNLGKTEQNLINNAIQSMCQNGQSIGVIPGLSAALGNIPAPVVPGVADTLYNAANRFNDPYVNTLKGAMFVTDASVWLYKKDLKLAATFGVASGDEDPNFDNRDGDFKGFIPLQEAYAGKRVKSAFFISGAGKQRRPFSSPEDPTQTDSIFPDNISGFTNLVFLGSGVTWTPTDWPKKFLLNPNIFCLWQQYATKKFDLATKKDSKTEFARNYLGTEFNLFIDFYLFESLKLYAVTSLFIPGGHYQDIRGKPLNAAQQAALDRLDSTGFTDNNIPNLGTSRAYTLNLGLEFKF